jgi:predicted nucleic acid-binding protein
MVLVDTSIWVEHLSAGHRGLEALLEEGKVACHELIIGELACGSIKNRREILPLLQALPSAIEAEHDEVLRFVDQHRLMGKGLGLIDVHLMASAVLSDTPLWTLDKTLKAEASRLGIAF